MRSLIQSAFVSDSKIFDCVQHLESKVEKNEFTAWSFANSQVAVSGFWADEWTPVSPGEELHPTFDLASLTKPFFINALLRLKYGVHFYKLLSSPLQEWAEKLPSTTEYLLLLKHFFQHEGRHLSIDSFLSHKSGAKRWFWMGAALWHQRPTKYQKNENISQAKLNLFLLTKPRDEVLFNLTKLSLRSIDTSLREQEIYSDINYLILSLLYESNKIDFLGWDKELDFLNRSLNSQFTHASLNPVRAKNSIPSYKYIALPSYEKKREDEFGVLYDTNANIFASLIPELKIVSAHAGLVGNIIDITKATCFLQQNQQDLLVQKDNANLKHSTSRFLFGLDTPSSPNTLAGINHWSDNLKMKVFGHLGSSGTSFWFHLPDENQETKKYHCLLTNRVSSRLSCLSHKVPRLFIFSHLHSNEKIFIRKINNKYEKIKQEEYYENAVEFSNLSHLCWNKNNIGLSCDISETRRFIGKNLWQI
ncbi:MAG: hypothetical protein K2X39_06195 [Silvanigrellaceae bacterium]|nr:hypothetical protein [Silvanigrellaceae bacterium]